MIDVCMYIHVYWTMCVYIYIYIYLYMHMISPCLHNYLYTCDTMQTYAHVYSTDVDVQGLWPVFSESSNSNNCRTCRCGQLVRCHWRLGLAFRIATAPYGWRMHPLHISMTESHPNQHRVMSHPLGAMRTNNNNMTTCSKHFTCQYTLKVPIVFCRSCFILSLTHQLSAAT